MKPKKWTKQQDNFLLDHWEESNETIADVIERTPAAVNARRYKLKPPQVQQVRNNKTWTKGEVKKLIDNWQLTNQEIETILDRKASAIVAVRSKIRSGKKVAGKTWRLGGDGKDCKKPTKRKRGGFEFSLFWGLIRIRS